MSDSRQWCQILGTLGSSALRSNNLSSTSPQRNLYAVAAGRNDAFNPVRMADSDAKGW